MSGPFQIAKTRRNEELEQNAFRRECVLLQGSKTIQHHFCTTCGCGTYTETPDWSTGEPDFDNPKISINARLFDDFDLDAVPVTMIDGCNLW